MRVLVTGSDGYIGTVLVPMLVKRGYDVTGLDAGYYAGCSLGPEPHQLAPTIVSDIRDVTVEQLRGFGAVIHLAAISNDPVGDLNPECTYSINHRATVRLAELAKEAGVPRFLFSSSCSLYGAAGDAMLDENAAFNPVTPYGESKIWSEHGLSKLAGPTFTPTYLRNATAYGFSPRLRGDLVVNNLVAHAYTTGEVLIKSDGTPWRPLVHIEDISRAFVAILEAPSALIHDRAFNVGRTSENYQVRDVASMVARAVPGSKVTYAPGAQPDIRDYRVSCDLIQQVLPAFQPEWTVERGIAELLSAYCEHHLTIDHLNGPLMRIARVKDLQAHHQLSTDLRWVSPHTPSAAVVA